MWSLQGLRLLDLFGNSPVRLDLKPQSFWKTFSVSTAGLPIGDNRNHAIAAAQHFEVSNLLIHMTALRRIWGTENDQKLRSFKSGNCLFGKRMSCGKIFAVAENRPQTLRHRTDRSFATDQIPVDTVMLKGSLQPLGPPSIAVAVA